MSAENVPSTTSVSEGDDCSDDSKYYAVVTRNGEVSEIKVVQGATGKTGADIGDETAKAHALVTSALNGKFTFDSTVEATVTDTASGSTIVSTSASSTVSVANNATKLTLNGIDYTLSGATSGATFVPGTDAAKGATKIYGLASGATVSFSLGAGITDMVVGSASDSTTTFTSETAASEMAVLMVGTTPALTKAEKIAVATQITVAKDASTTSTVTAKTDTDNSVKVDISDGKYTISGLGDGDVVTIDGVDYTYTASTTTLSSEERNYLLKTDGTIAFDIANGVDAVDKTTAVVAVGALTDTSLSDIAEKLGNEETAYFVVDGTQEFGSSDNTAYTFKKETASTYTLTSTDKAVTTGVDINASGITGLTLALEEGDAANAITIDDDTTIVAAALGKDDTIVKDGDLVGAATAGATLTVTKGIVALTSGTYASAVAGVTVSTSSEKTVLVGTNADNGLTFDGTEEATANADKATATYVDGGITLTAGKLSVGASVESQKIGDVTYTSSGALVFRGSNESAYLTSAASATGATGGAVLVGTEDATGALTATSSVTLADAGSGVAPKIVVTGGVYTISGLIATSKVTIDKTEYTYDATAKTLKVGEQAKYLLANDGTVAFTIAGGTDSFTDTIASDSAVAYVGPLSAINTVASTMSDGTYYFDKDGKQQATSTTPAYTLTRETDGTTTTYNLTDSANATGGTPAININLTGMAVTLNLANGTNTETVTVGEGTTITGGQIKASDVVQVGDGSTAKATVLTGETGTFNAASSKITLTNGKYDTTGTTGVDIKTTSKDTVQIGTDANTGMTFGGAEDGDAATGSYSTTGGANVSEGKLVVGKSIASPKVNEVTYTNNDGSATALTFYGAYLTSATKISADKAVSAADDTLKKTSSITLTDAIFS